MTEKLSFLNLKVARTLVCLRDGKEKSMEEITREYNQKYPPHRLPKTLGVSLGQERMYKILEFLVKEGIVESHGPRYLLARKGRLHIRRRQ